MVTKSDSVLRSENYKLYSFITTNSVVYHAVLCAMISWKRHKVKQKTNKIKTYVDRQIVLGGFTYWFSPMDFSVDFE